MLTHSLSHFPLLFAADFGSIFLLLLLLLLLLLNRVKGSGDRGRRLFFGLLLLAEKIYIPSRPYHAAAGLQSKYILILDMIYYP